MRGLNLLPLSALACTAAFAWALPLTPETSSLVSRGQLPANARLATSERYAETHFTVPCSVPDPTSHSLFDRRNTLALRTPVIDVYRAPGTETKVLIKAGWVALNMQEVLELLRATIKLAKQRIVEHGDEVIPVNDLVALGSAMVGEGVYLTLANANNHQLTYGVVLAAAVALSDFFSRSGGFQSVDFQIIDGKNLVGTGKIVA